MTSLSLDSAVREFTVKSSSYSYKTVLSSIEKATWIVRIYIDLAFGWDCICGASTSGYHFGYFLQHTFQSCQGRWTYLYFYILYFIFYTSETRNRPFLKVKFANKGIDALNLSDMLNQKSVHSKILPYFQYKESPCISYSYTRSVASKFFLNYKASLQQIDLDGLSQNPTPCSCCDSEFLYAPCGHIVTGDFSIVRNQKLKDVLRKGPKYREPVSFSWHQNLISSWTRVRSMPDGGPRKRMSKSTLCEWVKSIADVLKRRIRRLKRSVNTRHESIFCDPEVVR